MNTFKITRRVVLLAGAASIAGCVRPATQPLFAQDAAAAVKGFALVELFTSQGCNSCPPADENLARIERLAGENGLPVYTLSFHVDYWNQLGWTDPFSQAKFSHRQRVYARAFEAKGVYTPQMIVNGRTEFLGSNARLANQAVAAGLRQAASANLRIDVKRDEERLRVRWKFAGAGEDDVLNVALVEDRASRKVTAGENDGKTLEHCNVVREFQTIASPKAKGEAELPLPKGLTADECHVVAYLQGKRDGVIHAAVWASIRQ